MFDSKPISCSWVHGLPKGQEISKENCLVLYQKYSRLRCLLHVLGLVIGFYLGWSGSTLQLRQNFIKVGSKSWLFTCSSNITLSLPSYTGSALKRELNFCNDYLSLLYFWPLSFHNPLCISHVCGTLDLQIIVVALQKKIQGQSLRHVSLKIKKSLNVRLWEYWSVWWNG